MAVLARAEITLSGMDYVTNSEFTKTTESITAKVEQSAKTASQALDMASEVKQTAAGISATVKQHYEEQSAALDRISKVEQTAKGLSSTVSATQSTLAAVKLTADNAAPKVWHRTLGAHGVAGWFHVCRLTILGTYANRAIRMSLANRMPKQTIVTIQFLNANNTDPALGLLRRDGPCPVAIVRSAAATWDLYAQKAERYDDLTVTGLDMPYYTRPSLEWQTDQVDALPDDATQAVEQIGSRDADSYTTKSEFTQTTESITATVSKKLDSATAESTYAKQSELKQTADSLTVSISQTVTRADALADQQTDLSDRLDTADQNLSNLSESVAAEVEERKSYMRFGQQADGGPVLELGASASQGKVQLTDDRLSFLSGDSEVAYVGNDRLYINNAQVLNTLRIGNFMWTPRSDGHLSLIRT